MEGLQVRRESPETVTNSLYRQSIWMKKYKIAIKITTIAT